MNRSEVLERVRNRLEPWDIVVIGGGATGAGCALDAASRGLDVLLLERDDFGKGTSSRSTKLVHGGVRYLAHGDISLVREALKERGILFKNAPHVVHKLAFVIPCYSLWQKIFFGTGLKIYDLLSGKYSLGRSRILSREQTIEHLPTAVADGLSGGVLYFDGQFDDARLLVDLVKTADSKGAAILNYAKVTSVEKDLSGKISGLVFEDVETKEALSIFAKAVINATGIFCDDLRNLADATAPPLLVYSQGIHLVLDRKFLKSEDALMIPKTTDGRVLFCIPWLGSLLVGTTDTPVDHVEIEPKALESEIDFILKNAAKYLSPAPTRGDILSIFAGIRPLVRSGTTANTAKLARGHFLETSSSGLITITGGKWTTYRRMAEDAVDQAIRIAELDSGKSNTSNLKILANDELTSGQRMNPQLPYFEEDVRRAVTDELARTVEDVLARRTRILFLNADAALEIAPRVAAIMADELTRDDKWIEDQLNDFRQLAQSYLPPIPSKQPLHHEVQH
ncbi:MAG: glycerol-3-phosphate dehydrogenase/oxidase [Acidobacteriota bacterium]